MVGSMQVFNEGIGLILQRWSALQIAVDNHCGGRHSHLKAQQFAIDIFSWFTQSKKSLDIYDLEDILYEDMYYLNMVIEDGSVEEVAEKLMVMHEECLEGNFKSVEALREAVLKQPAQPHVPQIVNDDEDDDEDSDSGEEDVIEDDNSANMDVDIPNSKSDMNSVNRSDNRPLPEVASEAADGWVVVNRKNKGRKN